MLLGRQIVTDEPGVIKHKSLRSGEAYNHSIETFQKLVDEVIEATGIKLNVEAEHSEVRREGNYKMMRFCLARR